MAAPSKNGNRSGRTERSCGVENEVDSVARMEIDARTQEAKAVDEHHVAQAIAGLSIGVLESKMNDGPLPIPCVADGFGGSRAAGVENARCGRHRGVRVRAAGSRRVEDAGLRHAEERLANGSPVDTDLAERLDEPGSGDSVRESIAEK